MLFVVFFCAQLKWCLSERLGASAEQLVLVHCGRALSDSELMSHIKGQNGSVSLCMIQRYTEMERKEFTNCTC